MLISLDYRFEGLDGVAHTNCFMNVDGTDYPGFVEPSSWPWSKHITKKAVKYEIGVCLKIA